MFDIVHDLEKVSFEIVIISEKLFSFWHIT